jgi:DNA repair exonuclease SbcCD ATPase subunit
VNLNFEALELENFGPFNEVQKLYISALEPGLHFVTGKNLAEPRLDPNGVGKSTIWAALTWCLYGKTVKGLRNPDVTPWNGSKRVRVAVQINGRIVKRTANPNALTLDDMPVGQEQVDKLVGLSFEAFTHTVLYGQGRPLFFDLPPREMMDVLSDVLGLERWELRSAAASQRARDLEQELETTSFRQRRLEGNLETLSKNLRSLQAASDDWEAEHAERQKKFEAERKDVIKKLATIEPKCAELSARFDWLGAQIKLIDPDYRKAQENLYAAKQILGKMELEVDRWKRGIVLLVGRCPECNQPVDESHKRAANKRAREKAAEAIEALRPQKKKVAKLEREQQTLLEAAQKFKDEADELEGELRTIERTVADLKAKANAVGKQQSEEASNPFRDQISAARKEKKQTEVLIAECTTQFNKLTRRIARARWWVKGFKDVRLHVIDEVLTELELTTATVLEELGLIGWQVTYASEKDTKKGTTRAGLNVQIKSPGSKKAVKWESWSGGEGQRLRLVGALALSEVLLNHAGLRTNLEVFDEVTTYMPVRGVRDLCDLLAERCAALGRVGFYIDHQIGERSSFASVIRVQKDKSGATIC